MDSQVQNSSATTRTFHITSSFIAKHVSPTPGSHYFNLLQHSSLLHFYYLSFQEWYVNIPPAKEEGWEALPRSYQVNIEIQVPHFTPLTPSVGDPHYCWTWMEVPKLSV